MKLAFAAILLICLVPAPFLCAEEITIKVTALEMSIDQQMHEKVSRGILIFFGRELEEKFGKDAWRLSETQAIETDKEFDIQGERTEKGRIAVSGLVKSLGDERYAANLKLNADLVTPHGRSGSQSDSDAFFSKNSPSYFNGHVKCKRGKDGRLYDFRVRLVKIEVVEP